MCCHNFLKFYVTKIASNGADSDTQGEETPVESDKVIVFFTLPVRLVEDQDREQYQHYRADQPSANLQSYFNRLINSQFVIIQVL